jgi:DME family drug/metabolite transporter
VLQLTAGNPGATTPARSNRVVGYLFALGAGATWGTTGPLSTGLYSLMPATSIGFWRVLIGTVALAIWGVLFRRDLFRADRRGWLLIGLGGGALVALFEIAYQFAIAGVGVAGAAALLYTAPVMVAILARVILKEALTATRIALAFVVMVGVALTVTGGSNAGAEAARMCLTACIAGGWLSALSYALTSLMGRYAAPRYGVVKVLFLEAVGGVILIWIALAIWGRAPTVPPSPAAWRGLLGLAAGSVIAANLLFFGAMKRIEAAPASVAATIEPVVGALLALLLFSQRLTLLGWLGLLMVVAGVATGYVLEGLKQQLDPDAEEAGRPV